MTLQIIEALKHIPTSSILLVYPYPHSFKTQINRCKAPNKKLGNQNQKKEKRKEKTKKKLEIISTWKRLSLDTYECRPFLIFKPLTKFAVEEALTQKQSTFSLIDDKFFGKPR